MRFAAIVPVCNAEALVSGQSFHLVLAHLLFESPTYRAFYEKLVIEGHVDITLDNSVVEIGSPLEDEFLIRAAEATQPNLVVLPDFMGDSGATLHYLEHESERLIGGVLDVSPKSEFIASLQTLESATVAEVVDVVKRYIEIQVNTGFFQHLGISKSYEMVGVPGVGLGGRAKILQEIVPILPKGMKVHMLGIRKDPVAEIKSWTGLYSHILGVDSAKPYRIARLGRRISEARPYPPSIDDLADDLLPAPTLEFVRSELASFRKWVSGLE